MGVWEAEEEKAKLGAGEEVGQEFHCVGAQDGNVGVGLLGGGYGLVLRAGEGGERGKVA